MKKASKGSKKVARIEASKERRKTTQTKSKHDGTTTDDRQLAAHDKTKTKKHTEHSRVFASFAGTKTTADGPRITRMSANEGRE